MALRVADSQLSRSHTHSFSFSSLSHSLTAPCLWSSTHHSPLQQLSSLSLSVSLSRSLSLFVTGCRALAIWRLWWKLRSGFGGVADEAVENCGWRERGTTSIYMHVSLSVERDVESIGTDQMEQEHA